MSGDLAINAARPPPSVLQSSPDLLVENMTDKRDECANANYKRDLHHVFKPSSWFLGSIGIWPLAIRGPGQHISKIAILFCNFALCFAIVPCALHIIYDQKDLNLKLKLCGLLGFCTTSMLKYWVLAIRRFKIQRCIEYVKNDWWKVGVIGVCQCAQNNDTVRGIEGSFGKRYRGAVMRDDESSDLAYTKWSYIFLLAVMISHFCHKRQFVWLIIVIFLYCYI